MFIFAAQSMQTVKVFKDRQLIIFGLALALLLFLLRWLEFRFIIIEHSIEIFTGAIAVIFTLLGIWLALKLVKPKVKTIVVEKEIHVQNRGEFVFNRDESERLGLSSREIEVLSAMSQGLSNQEIADRLFLSLNTVKTHSSRLFEKLDVKRRTQAVEKGKKLNIIP